MSAWACAYQGLFCDDRKRTEITSTLLTLPSNASLEVYPTNVTSDYRVQLAKTIQLRDGQYEVALAGFIYPRTWYNFDTIYSWLLRQGCHPIRYNRKMIQGFTSRTCGAYCAYFLHMRAMGVPMNMISDTFRGYQFDFNDTLVRTLLKKLR